MKVLFDLPGVPNQPVEKSVAERLADRIGSRAAIQQGLGREIGDRVSERPSTCSRPPQFIKIGQAAPEQGRFFFRTGGVQLPHEFFWQFPGAIALQGRGNGIGHVLVVIGPVIRALRELFPRVPQGQSTMRSVAQFSNLQCQLCIALNMTMSSASYNGN